MNSQDNTYGTSILKNFSQNPLGSFPGGGAALISMRAVLMAKSGATWTLWLPAGKEGHYRFSSGSGAEDELPLFVRGDRNGWIAFAGREAVFALPNHMTYHEMPLTDKLFSNYYYKGELYALYVEAVSDDDFRFVPYYLEERSQYLIGRPSEHDSGRPDICYRNIAASREHAILFWRDDGWYITDRSLNGTYVNGKRITTTALRIGDCIFIMGLYILVGAGYMAINNYNDRVEITTPKIRRIQRNQDVFFPECPPKTAERRLFDRRPRKYTLLNPEKISIDLPPMALNGNKIPLLLRLGNPILMGGSALARGNILMAMTSLVLPSLTQGMTEKDHKEYEIKRKETYRKYLADKEQEIVAEKRDEEQRLNEISPVLSKVMEFALRKERLWERRKGDTDFLSVRIGSGALPLLAERDFIKKKFSLEDDPLMEEMYALSEKEFLLENAPITVSLQEDHALGIIGDHGRAISLIRNMILQLCILHSYDELKIILLAEKRDMALLDFLRYLPHNWDDERSVRFYANKQADALQISEYLTLQSNAVDSRENKDLLVPKSGPAYVVFALSKELYDSMEIFKECLKREAYCGISLVTAFEGIPKECTRILDLNEQPVSIDLIHPTESERSFVLDPFDKRLAKGAVDELMHTKLKVGSAKYTLPGMLTFLEMFGAGKVEHLNPLKRWADNNPVKSLATPVGVGTDGRLFMLDLHQKRQGPHGLVAGMTGSGKSEFILTYILSMAVNYSPDEVAFILIDYKGGGLADAFENKALGIHLPHIVGTITNLDGASIQRSLMSINSELKRRQQVFKDAKTETGEGTMDIYDYQKLYRNGKVKEPMPHLFIISDEFAELKSQQPEFMNELISAARIGRSLGVHLILATQKPGGVVNEQIWSNTKFRVCLRVQDRSDSMEMLKRPEAAELKNTGRFYLQVGYNEFFALGQSAWCGAEYVSQDEMAVEEDNSVQFLDSTGQTILTAKPAVHRSSSGLRQIVAVVQYLSDLAKQERIAPKSLWMDPLPDVIELDPFLRSAPAPEDQGIHALIGMIDDPERQAQFPYDLDLLSFHNMMLVGASGSGKSTYIRSMLYSLVNRYTPQQLSYYILDLSNGMLGGYAKMPHCGAYLTEENEDDVPRLFQLLRELVEERKALFLQADVGSFEAYCRIRQIPLVLVIIDNYTNLPSLSCGEQLLSGIVGYLREGANFGVRYILSCNHTNEIAARAKQEIDHHVALRAKDRYEYADIVEVKCGIVPSEKVGRGICVVDGRPLEYQTALLDGALPEQDRAAALQGRVPALREKYQGIPGPKKLQIADISQPFREFCQSFQTDRIPLGYSAQEMKPVAIPLKQFHSVSCYFGNPKGVAPILDALLTAAELNRFEVLVLKRGTGSLFTDPPLSNCAAVSAALDCTEENIGAMADRVMQEIVARNQLCDSYCRDHNIPESASGRAKKAAGYIRANSRPLLLLFESFGDFCATCGEGEREGQFRAFFEKLFGYNIYFAACFYPEDDSKLGSTELMKSYNKDEFQLLFGGRYDKMPLRNTPYDISRINAINQQYHQYLMKYQSTYHSMVMPGCAPNDKPEDPDDAPII